MGQTFCDKIISFFCAIFFGVRSKWRWLSVRQVPNEIFAGSDSNFDPKIEAIRANAAQNADSSITSDESGDAEPRDDTDSDDSFDPQPSTSAGRGLTREARRCGRVKGEQVCAEIFGYQYYCT